ncbi:hypothetical protein [Nocardia yunnanensis]|nr:hypothetical protein [Nocardia yunnanensis]
MVFGQSFVVTDASTTLGRAWMRIIWACWRTKIAYNPTRHEPEKQPIAA